jgi:Uma2 family endonuclease
MAMINVDQKHLPSSLELPDSDDIPVDNEDQNWVPNVLLLLLKYIWAERTDWFFGVDMGFYHDLNRPRIPIVPDGFLSLGVERRRNNNSRRSYVLWEENIVPILTLEMVSWTPGGEYDHKMAIYQNLGVLYYAIYNREYWQRDGHQPLEIYKLVNGQYQLQIGEPLWMPEIGLGLGRCQEVSGAVEQEVLSWFNERGDRYLRPEEQLQAERAQAQIDREQLLARLRELGEDI